MFDFNSFDLNMDNGGKYAAYSCNGIPRNRQMRLEHSSGMVVYWHHMLTCATTNLNPLPHVKTIPHEVLLFCTAPTMPKNDNEVSSSNRSAVSGRKRVERFGMNLPAPYMQAVHSASFRSPVQRQALVAVAPDELLKIMEDDKDAAQAGHGQPGGVPSKRRHDYFEPDDDDA